MAGSWRLSLCRPPNDRQRVAVASLQDDRRRFGLIQAVWGELLITPESAIRHSQAQYDHLLTQENVFGLESHP
jgi:hypothetical protein